MNIGIVGLGLIGGSIAKAIKHNTEHAVYGMDLSKQIILQAKLLNAIDDELKKETLSSCELVIMAIYPGATIAFIEENAKNFKKNALVVDCSGIKRAVCSKILPIAEANSFIFVGGHPMAGVEYSGFTHSKDSLFENATMILTPDKTIDIQIMDNLKQLFLSIGFTNIKISTPEDHDRMIAYTSQLAHILSSAYVKSQAALSHKGYTAGSFRDMTRVARLNEEMWTELFLLNGDNLISEIYGLSDRLRQYGDAIRDHDAEELRKLLKEGRERKVLVESEEGLK